MRNKTSGLQQILSLSLFTFRYYFFEGTFFSRLFFVDVLTKSTSGIRAKLKRSVVYHYRRAYLINSQVK